MGDAASKQLKGQVPALKGVTKRGGCIQASPSPNLFNRNLRAYSRRQHLSPRRIRRMGKTVFPAKGRCHVMRSCHVVENSFGGSLPPRMRGLETRPLPNTNGKVPNKSWTLHADEDRGAWREQPLIRQCPRQFVDPTLKPTARELLPRLIGFPLESRAVLHDMWQLFLAVQLIPFPRLHLHVNSKAHSPPLGSWDNRMVDSGPWMRG